jgi:hypothetical protein
LNSHIQKVSYPGETTKETTASVNFTFPDAELLFDFRGPLFSEISALYRVLRSVNNEADDAQTTFPLFNFDLH